MKYDNQVSNFDLNIFSKMWFTSQVKNNMLLYPGFIIYPDNISKSQQHDNNFHFVQKINWRQLENRPKNVKLIVCFGNSALKEEYLSERERITFHIQEHFNMDEYIVLNLGVSGYTIYEQMLLYNALVYPLKPEFVISIGIGTDWRVSLVSCKEMMITHKMIYTTPTWENATKISLKSNLPLLYENGSSERCIDNSISDEDINTAIVTRIEQFKNIVESNGGVFICYLQALLPFKKKQTQKEQYYNQLGTINGYGQTYINTIKDKRVFNLAKSLNEMMRERTYFYDLNQVIANEEKHIFDYWIHCNPYGNKLVANFIAEKIKERIKEKETLTTQKKCNFIA